MRLAVRQFGNRVGLLESTPDRGIVFAYDVAYLASGRARSLSVSLPLRSGEYTQAEAIPFFAGLLPDGEQRRRIADYLHISEASTLRLLDALGGECAGTISIDRATADDDDDDDDDDDGSGTGRGSTDAGGYEELTNDELSALILESERRPLLAPRGAVRLSLAGAQEKLPLVRRDGRWFRPLGGAPTTHILKPSSARFPDIVANEFLCMRLAERLGIGVPRVEMVTLGRPVLVIERYDRRMSSDGVERLHQEDFCQALGIMPDRKYQADGGPGFADISRIIRTACARPLKDVERLIRVALFNTLIGNCDAHGKNFSILYNEEGATLAPFYDLLSTTVYPELERKLSMKIGKENHIDKIDASDLAAFAVDIGVRPRLVAAELEGLLAKADTAWEVASKSDRLELYGNLTERVRDDWRRRARRLGG